MGFNSAFKVLNSWQYLCCDRRIVYYSYFLFTSKFSVPLFGHCKSPSRIL